MIVQETYKLANGIEIPKLGLGTWYISNKDVTQAVLDAIELGYRHIDTAQAYRNEKGVGQGIRDSGVNGEDLFVTTKLGAGVKSYEKAVASIDKSLQSSGLDYIDMMIIHILSPGQNLEVMITILRVIKTHGGHLRKRMMLENSGLLGSLTSNTRILTIS